VGTNGLGGHGHEDKLSFVLSVCGLEVFVDPGVYAYTALRSVRAHDRSVLVHNTVSVDGEPQNRPADASFWWGVHEDTRCSCSAWEPSPDACVFEGCHHGYERLPAKVLHRRRIATDDRARRFIIRDKFSPGAEILPPMFFTFVLHPECQAAIHSDGSAILRRGSLEMSFSAKAGSWRIEKAFVAPSYGVRLPTTKLVVYLESGVAENEFVLDIHGFGSRP
jgi:hypothetical protein